MISLGSAEKTKQRLKRWLRSSPYILLMRSELCAEIRLRHHERDWWSVVILDESGQAIWQSDAAWDSSSEALEAARSWLESKA